MHPKVRAAQRLARWGDLCSPGVVDHHDAFPQDPTASSDPETGVDLAEDDAVGFDGRGWPLLGPRVEPLGMRSTDYLDDHRRIVPRRATGYTEKRGGGFEVEASDWEQTGDGGLQTSVPDLALWVRNFSEPLVGGRAMIQELTTPGRLGNGQAISYALGLRVDEYRGARRIGHGGSWAGFRAVVTLLPEHRFAAITLCNLSSAQPSELARKVVDVYLEKELRPEKTAGHSKTEDHGKPTRLSPGELARYAGLYWDRHEDSVRRVVLRDGRLFYQRGPQDESGLEPLGVSRFRLQGTASRIEVVFSASASGGAGQMRVSVDGGEPDLYERRAPANPSPAELTAYAGHYTSEELAARYEIVWAGGRLRLRRSGYPEADVEPLFRDSFREEEIGLLLFARDASGRVCGFTVRAGDSTLLFAREPASLGDPELPLR